MKFDELIKRLNVIDKELRLQNPNLSNDEVTMSRTLKMIEELGELANEILSSLNLQRKSKLAKFKSKNLDKEWADVMITLMHLGMHLGIEPASAIDKRLKQVKKRFEQEREK